MNLTEDEVSDAPIQSSVDRHLKNVKRAKMKSETELDDSEAQLNEEIETEIEENEKSESIKKKKKLNTSKTKKCKTSSSNFLQDPNKLEENSSQVLQRFKRGCECQDDQCFEGLSPEAVYKHRLNIAELTKAEHDMYLMGLLRNCLSNPYETSKHTERQRLRTQYVYQGRRVCLDAFLYLENCTHYQVKRIRKHLSIHGVAPRVHGNHGKVPHNTFSLDIYQIATDFVKEYINEQRLKQKTKSSSNAALYLPPEITRKTVHNLYKEYCKNSSPNVKILGYSTFRTFLKVQFPQLRFAKLEFVARVPNTQVQSVQKNELENVETTTDVLQCAEIVNDNGDLVPVIFASEPINETQTYILTSSGELQQGVSYQITKRNILINKGDPMTITNINAI